MKILFILKYRDGYTQDYSCGKYFSSGLYWSAQFITEMLGDLGAEIKLVQVNDNNDIDREVSQFRPDIVIIEALWVVPEKFDVLKKLHPSVKWIVRLHSNIPFLAEEGVAISWIKKYAERGVIVAVNAKRALRDVKALVGKNRVLFLPNFYPLAAHIQFKASAKNTINIGCYGAIRPLKNQLLQAIAAIGWADKMNLVLRFHINIGRVERGENALKNLRALFKDTKHTLIEDKWMSHDNFVTCCKKLDLGMQTSLSETFSIVAADMVNAGIPIVVSDEVRWASYVSKVDPTSSKSIEKGLTKAFRNPEQNIRLNRQKLKAHNQKAKATWTCLLS